MVGGFVGWLVGWLVSPSTILVYLKGGCEETVSRVANGHHLQIQLTISPKHSILTPGQPDPAWTIEHSPDRGGTRVVRQGRYKSGKTGEVQEW